MVLEKRPLNLADIEAQTALELPERETLATVVLSCLAVCVGKITIRDVDITVTALNDLCVTINNVISVLSGAAVACNIK